MGRARRKESKTTTGSLTFCIVSRRRRKGQLGLPGAIVMSRHDAHCSWHPKQTTSLIGMCATHTYFF